MSGKIFDLNPEDGNYLVNWFLENCPKEPECINGQFNPPKLVRYPAMADKYEFLAHAIQQFNETNGPLLCINRWMCSNNHIILIISEDEAYSWVTDSEIDIHNPSLAYNEIFPILKTFGKNFNHGKISLLPESLPEGEVVEAAEEGGSGV